MKYLIINPFYNATNGVSNYTKNAVQALDGVMDVEVFTNNKNLTKRGFQKEVYKYVTSNYGVEEVIIEAPESRASTLLLPKEYKVHLRLHCPLAVAQKYDGFNPDQTTYSEELRVIHKAKVVSSPSYGLLKEMNDEIDPDKYFVYKNTYNKDIKLSNREEKEYDIVFLGRFQKLKGIEYLNPVLERIPDNYKVLLIGNNSTKYKLSKNIKCNVTIHEHIPGDERFDLIGKAKTLVMLSRFENCSMVILESLAAGTVVTAWDVGGNAEIASTNTMQIVPFEDIEKYTSDIVSICETKNYPTRNEFKKALDEIDEDFISGINSIVKYLSNEQDKNYGDFRHDIYRGLDFSRNHKAVPYKVATNLLQNKDDIFESNPFGKRILGFTISNEHIEEMWVPVVKKLGLEARYICRRPLGFHTVFNNPFPVEQKEFSQYDWMKNKDRLLKNIYTFKPNKLLFHNGLHPMYQDVLEEVKLLDIPIIYSELGWFPQKDNIYFDRWGTNGKSYLASLSAEAFCREDIDDRNKPSKKISGEHVLVVTQLENDTNLIVNSPLFKDNYNFVKHVINEVPESEEIIVKVHPLDKHWEKLLDFESDRVKIVKEGNLDEMIMNAKAVIGINSTVLIQSLKYDVNIYSYGYGLLDNKNVTISCIQKPLSKQWTEVIVGSRKRRDKIIEGFIKRQINIRELEKLSTKDIMNNIAFEPFLLTNQENFTKMNSRIQKLNLLDSSIKKESKKTATAEVKNNKNVEKVTNKEVSTKKSTKVEKKTNSIDSSKQNKGNIKKTSNENKGSSKSYKRLWIKRYQKFKRDPKIVITFLQRKLRNIKKEER